NVSKTERKPVTLAREEATPTFRSFRDPSGVLFRQGDRILRSVNDAAVQDLEAFLQTRTARDATRSGKLVGSQRVPASDITGIESAYVVEHERIPFPSYAYEWPPEMLHAAGLLTLDFAQQALEEGFGLKDATPYNVLFRGSQPVFVD